MTQAEKQFFHEKPKEQELYTAIRKKLQDAFSDAEIKVHKTQINFRTRKNFAFVWLPPREMKNRPEHYVVFTFNLGREVASGRFEEVVHPSARMWTYHLIFSQEEQLDEELMEWVQEAHQYSLR